MTLTVTESDVLGEEWYLKIRISTETIDLFVLLGLFCAPYVPMWFFESSLPGYQHLFKENVMAFGGVASISGIAFYLLVYCRFFSK